MSYLGFYAALAVCMLLSFYASSKVKRTYAKYDKIQNRLRMTGREAAHKLLSLGGVTDVSVGMVSGVLTDHYHSAKGVVNLSDATYGSTSVAAVAVAAHEIGHVMQNKAGYLFYRVRTAIVPLVNFGSHLAIPLVLVGLLLDLYVSAARYSNAGYYLALVGVALYGLSFLFALVTLPVELNASRRAGQMLQQAGVVTAEEMPAVRKVLSAAALTYLASLLTSLVYFLRFLFWVLSMFGRRRD